MPLYLSFISLPVVPSPTDSSRWQFLFAVKVPDPKLPEVVLKFRAWDSSLIDKIEWQLLWNPTPASPAGLYHCGVLLYCKNIQKALLNWWCPPLFTATGKRTHDNISPCCCLVAGRHLAKPRVKGSCNKCLLAQESEELFWLQFNQ